MSIKRLSTKSVLAYLCSIALVFVISVVFLGFVLPKDVTIVDSGSETKVSTLAKNVEELLEEKGITIYDNDSVTPPLSSEIEDNSVITIKRAKKVTLHADGKNYKLCTTTETVSKLLEELDITLEKRDLLSCELDAKIENGMEISVIRAKNVTVKVDGKVHNKLTNMATVKDFLENVCISLKKYDEVTPALETPITEGLEIKVARVTVETPTVEEAIPFTVVKKQSSEHFKGETVTQQKGVNGLAKNTYRVVKRDGKLVSKTLTNSETIKKATDKIVLVGTREKMGIASRGDLRYKKVITCTATAYDPGVHSNGKWAGITATGRPAGPGIVAVDPKVIPLNSRLYIESTDDGKSWTYGYAIAGDTGGAIKGNRIDLCYSTVAECYQFGRRQCKVYILE